MSLQDPEGSVIIVQAHDLLKLKRLIPGIAMWIQCFAIYVCIRCLLAVTKTLEQFGELIYD